MSHTGDTRSLKSASSAAATLFPQSLRWDDSFSFKRTWNNNKHFMTLSLSFSSPLAFLFSFSHYFICVFFFAELSCFNIPFGWDSQPVFYSSRHSTSFSSLLLAEEKKLKFARMKVFHFKVKIDNRENVSTLFHALARLIFPPRRRRYIVCMACHVTLDCYIGCDEWALLFATAHRYIESL